MLIVAGTYQIDPADIPAFRDAATVMMAATAEEPGCREYTFSVSVAEPGTVKLFEIWDSEQDLAEHFEMPHMADYRAKLGELNILSRDVSRYDVSGSHAL